MSFIVEKHMGKEIIYFDAAFDNNTTPHTSLFIVHKMNEVWVKFKKKKSMLFLFSFESLPFTSF